ncbi:hypothetical protein [Isoptericola sediminis]|uniref:Uncharacterized protein n=1 Tax=Isoptericola sediminis TaxID=2733572 RepID=A0A849JZJ8_9MICO|nr:hypothetical protein [Isoptericola sediminis]NNU27974.1 hypothetical protein [Isoptericola sediminis]
MPSKRYVEAVIEIKQRMKPKVDNQGHEVPDQTPAVMKTDWWGNLTYASRPDVGTFRLDHRTEAIEFDPPTPPDEDTGDKA